MSEILNIHPLLLVLLAVLLLAQGSWIFYDASKRGENKWLWGLLGIMNTPTNLIIYLIVTRKILKTKPCRYCRKRMKIDSKFCPHCGNEFD